jgi:hypothetical protein
MARMVRRQSNYPLGTVAKLREQPRGPVDPSTDAMSTRLQQGLADLARLADQAETVSRDQLWDLVTDLDAHTARAISFTAAELISRQREAQFAATKPAA